MQKSLPNSLAENFYKTEKRPHKQKMTYLFGNNAFLILFCKHFMLSLAKQRITDLKPNRYIWF